MHLLRFIIPNFLPIFVMIIAALAIFQAWIWVGVGIGKFLNDLGVRNIFNTKLHCLAAC
jgi:phosphotransferase system  glucose/maltose/N-acetylglucosamine-specific IIC component